MQYQQIGRHQQVNALNERIGQLEQAHYSNVVYQIEAVKVGDSSTYDSLTEKNLQIDVQWSAVVEERDRILEELENSEEVVDERELRG